MGKTSHTGYMGSPEMAVSHVLWDDYSFFLFHPTGIQKLVYYSHVVTPHSPAGYSRVTVSEFPIQSIFSALILNQIGFAPSEIVQTLFIQYFKTVLPSTIVSGRQKGLFFLGQRADLAEGRRPFRKRWPLICDFLRKFSK